MKHIRSILATADLDASTTGTVTFTFSNNLTNAEMIDMVQIRSHNYGSGPLTVGGQTYTANPGLFLSFSTTGAYAPAVPE